MSRKAKNSTPAKETTAQKKPDETVEVKPQENEKAQNDVSKPNETVNNAQEPAAQKKPDETVENVQKPDETVEVEPHENEKELNVMSKPNNVQETTVQKKSKGAKVKKAAIIGGSVALATGAAAATVWMIKKRKESEASAETSASVSAFVRNLEF